MTTSKHLDPPGRHRAEVRPRFGRIAALGSSVAVVLIAVLGGAGALPSLADGPPAKVPAEVPEVASGDVGTGTNIDDSSDQESSSRSDASTGRDRPAASGTEASDDDLVPVENDGVLIDTALPGDSGTGLRVVFSESRQRVWLVTESEKVRRTYLVSGSIYDNLDPGTFQVYSRDKSALGIDDSGSMKFFVRFTQGDAGAAIGFHDIPVDAGRPVQSIAQLGTPLSHGCIRQSRQDAVALWKFAPIGTTVVVTA